MMKIQLDDLSSIFRTFSHGEPNDKPIICGWFMLYNGDDLGMVFLALGNHGEISSARRD